MRIRIVSIMLVLFLLLTGCAGKADQNNASSTEKPVIRIGAMTSTDVIPFVIMNKNGLDDQNNFQLEIEMFTSAKDRDAAFQAGELDGVLTDLIGVTMYQNADFDVKITGSTDGDFILVAGKETGITDMSQLKGKAIGISENSLIDYSLDVILENNDLASTDVVKEIIPRMPDRYELLNNGELDFGLLPEPFSTLALQKGGIYLGSANDYGLYPAVSAFSQTALDEKSGAIQDLYKAYDEAVEYMNQTDIKEYEDTVIEEVGYPEDMKGEIELQPFRTNALPPQEDIEAAIKWASERELCSPDLTYDQMVYDVNK